MRLFFFGAFLGALWSGTVVVCGERAGFSQSGHSEVVRDDYPATPPPPREEDKYAATVSLSVTGSKKASDRHDFKKAATTFGRFWSSVGASFSLIFVSEIGDRTFFIAAILAATKPKVAVFLAASLALIVQSVIACIAGHLIHILPSNNLTRTLVKIPIDDYAAAVLLFVFGALHIRAACEPAGGSQEEAAEARALVAERFRSSQPALPPPPSSSNEYHPVLLEATLPPLAKQIEMFNSEEETHEPLDYSGSDATPQGRRGSLSLPLLQINKERVQKKHLDTPSTAEDTAKHHSSSKTEIRNSNFEVDGYTLSPKAPASFSYVSSAPDVFPLLSPKPHRKRSSMTAFRDTRDLKETLQLTQEMMSQTSSHPALSVTDLAVKTKVFWSTCREAFVLVLCAEIGDKSMISTVALAAAQNPYGVFLGSSVANSIVTGGAVLFGHVIQRYFSERATNIAGAILFISFGILTVFEALAKQGFYTGAFVAERISAYFVAYVCASPAGTVDALTSKAFYTRMLDGVTNLGRAGKTMFRL